METIDAQHARPTALAAGANGVDGAPPALTPAAAEAVLAQLGRELGQHATVDAVFGQPQVIGERTVIPVDILGHGTAPAPHDPTAYADLEQSVAAALPDEPVDAIGFSLGAQLLLRLAAEDPSRFGRLVVIGVGANLFSTDGVGALADAFEQGTEPENVTARLFVSLAASA